MRWLNGLTTEEEKRQREDWCQHRYAWHKWFAWHPVIIGHIGIRNHMAWLENVWRKGYLHEGTGLTSVRWTWEYAPYPEKKPEE